MCVFCKIAAGEIPAATLYEDEKFRVILDMAPVSAGHALIIPKNHIDNVFDAPEDILAAIFPLAKKIASAQKKGLGCDGINIVQNNGKSAGQTVFHLHVHSVPRFEDDGKKLSFKPDKTSEIDFAETAIDFAETARRIMEVMQ
ncbi:MAG: HIT family protein [Clostridiales bacterium]|jgi:histidine triad (HIT) family protein|nr:HIT family protein [Clostridiales bacterium]